MKFAIVCLALALPLAVFAEDSAAPEKSVQPAPGDSALPLVPVGQPAHPAEPVAVPVAPADSALPLVPVGQPAHPAEPVVIPVAPTDSALPFVPVGQPVKPAEPVAVPVAPVAMPEISPVGLPVAAYTSALPVRAEIEQPVKIIEKAPEQVLPVGASNVNFSGRALVSADGVLKLGGTAADSHVRLYENEPNFFYGPLFEARVPVLANRFLIASAPGQFWTGEIWGDGYNVNFGVPSNTDRPETVFLQSAWNGRQENAHALKVRAIDAAGKHSDWSFMPGGTLDAGGNQITNIAAVSFADGTKLTTAPAPVAAAPAVGITTNQTVGIGDEKIVLHIENGVITGITQP